MKKNVPITTLAQAKYDTIDAKIENIPYLTELLTSTMLHNPAVDELSARSMQKKEDLLKVMENAVENTVLKELGVVVGTNTKKILGAFLLEFGAKYVKEKLQPVAQG